MQTAIYNGFQIECKLIYDDMKYGRHNKQTYQILRTLTKISPRSTSIIEDSIGKLLADETKILK